jgi:FkbM family methyltransferase
MQKPLDQKTVGTIAYIDVGAANAVDKNFLPYFKDGRIQYIGFEPDSRSELEFPGLVHPVALGSKRETKLLNLCRKPEVSSFLRPNMEFIYQGFHRPERFDVVDQVEVEVVPLDDYFQQDVAYILKLDVQGFELEVLKGASRVLQNTVAIDLEVEFQELYENQPLFGEICSFLHKQGFQFEDFSRLVHWPRQGGSSPGMLVFGQALFVRDASRMENLGDSAREAMRIALTNFEREDLLLGYARGADGHQLARLKARHRRHYWLQQLIQSLSKRQWIPFHYLD